MKKTIILLLIIFPITLYAQRFKGGLMLGMNVSQIDGDNWGGYNKAGIVGGAYVSTAFTNKWGAQMEIRYAQKGSANPLYDPDRIRYRLQYIEVPVLAKYEPFNKFEFQLGLLFGYLFDAKRNDGYGYEELDDQPDETDVAFLAGINYKLTQRINGNARFSYSLMPVWQNYPGQNYGVGAWYNNVITFGIYYQLGQLEE